MTARPDPLRILFVLPAYYPALRYGGSVVSPWLLSKGLVEIGCQVRVLTTDANYGDPLPYPNGEVILQDGVTLG